MTFFSGCGEEGVCFTPDACSTLRGGVYTWERYRCSELRVLCLGYMEPGEPGEPMQEKELLVRVLEKSALLLVFVVPKVRR